MTILDLTRHESTTLLTLWEWIDEDVVTLTVGTGPLDEYRIWRHQGDTDWTLTLAGADEPNPLRYAAVEDAKRDAVRHLSSMLWDELTP